MLSRISQHRTLATFTVFYMVAWTLIGVVRRCLVHLLSNYAGGRLAALTLAYAIQYFRPRRFYPISTVFGALREDVCSEAGKKMLPPRPRLL